MLLDLLHGLDEGTEATAAGAEGVVGLVALHTQPSQQPHNSLLSHTLMSYRSRASVLNIMMGMQGVMHRLRE